MWQPASAFGSLQALYQIPEKLEDNHPVHIALQYTRTSLYPTCQYMLAVCTLDKDNLRQQSSAVSGQVVWNSLPMGVKCVWLVV